VNLGKKSFLPLYLVVSVTLGLLGSLVACTSTPASPSGVGTEQDPLTQGGQNGLGGQDDPFGQGPGQFVTPDEYSTFCQKVSSNILNGSIAFEDLIATYREALEFAPAEISSELAALLDFLEFGIEPDYGEPSVSTPVAPMRPTDPDTSETDQESQVDQDSPQGPDSEPTDPFVFIAPNAEQLALSVAEFLETHCRGVTVSPLPAPTVPAAPEPE